MLSTRFIRFSLVKYILWGFFLVGFSNGFLAQSNPVSWEYNYDHFGIENGIPSSETYQVHQDRSGLLWILTDRGVVRYDGFRFEIFTIESGLSDNVNFRIVEDAQGGVWFVGLNGLLSVYKGGEMHPYKYNHILKKIFSIGRNVMTSFYVREDNSVVYGITKKKVVSISDHGKVTDLLKDYKANHVYVFEHNNKFVICDYSMTLEEIPVIFNRQGKSRLIGIMPYGGTVRMKKYHGDYFAMSNRKLHVFYSGQFHLLPSEQEVISLDSDAEFLYVGYYKNGMKKFRFNSKTKELVLVQHYLPDYSISSVCKDKNGGLWMTTLEKGVFVLYDEAFTQLSIGGSPVDEEIRYVVGNKDKVVVTHYVGKWQQLYPPYLLKNYGKTLDWNTLVPFRNGFVFQKNQLDWSDWPEVDDSYEFAPHHVNETSVFGIKNDARAIEMVSGKSREVFDLKPIHKHRLAGIYLLFHLVPHKKVFFLLNQGVFVFDLTASRAKGNYKLILQKRISQIKYSKEWGLLAYSNLEGLYHIDTETEKVSRFAPEVNLGKQILSIFFDEKSRLWVASEKGLHLLEKKEGKVSAKLFLNRDLLSSREITCMYSYDNLLYLATKFGVQKIDFLKVKKQRSKNPIKLLCIRAFANNKLLEDKNVYSSKTDLIRISLANADLCKRNIYRYRFRNDQTWTKSDKGEITLNDPADGKYNLEVAYLNLRNEWSEPKHLLRFEVERVIFLRWYFILIYIALVGILFYVVLRYTVRAVNRKNQLLNRMVELERMALAAQMNPHFIFNSLNSIHSFLLYEENENAEKYLLRFAKLIRQTLANSRKSYITIEEEYETLKNYILLEKMRFKNTFDFTIDCDLRQLPIHACIPPMLIQPYVENAILHGLVKRPEGGQLLLKFYLEDEVLKVLIEDNGIGYSESKKEKGDSKHKSYGTQITEERLKSLQGKNNSAYTVSITNAGASDPEFPGTRVIVTIPIQTN
ncbi:Sensor histidine kinase YpdA [compost metagenome]